MSIYNQPVIAENNVNYIILPDKNKTFQIVWLTFSTYAANDMTYMIIPVERPETFQLGQNEWPYKRFKRDVEDSFWWPETDKPLYNPLYDFTFSQDGKINCYFVNSANESELISQEIANKYPHHGFLLIHLEAGKRNYGPICWTHGLATKGELFVPIDKKALIGYSDVRIYTLEAGSYIHNKTDCITKTKTVVNWNNILEPYSWDENARWSLWERRI